MNPYLSNLRQPKQVWYTYILLYIPVGFVMNAFGGWAKIAMFSQWWQVLTCYGLYLIPASILVKHRSWTDQYLCGLFFLGLLELSGYALQTSIAFQGNIVDQVLGTRNFSLAMTLFFAGLIPAGNYMVNRMIKRANRTRFAQRHAELAAGNSLNR